MSFLSNYQIIVNNTLFYFILKKIKDIIIKISFLFFLAKSLKNRQLSHLCNFHATKLIDFASFLIDKFYTKLIFLNGNKTK